jgi:hypothetical protein
MYDSRMSLRGITRIGIPDLVPDGEVDLLFAVFQGHERIEFPLRPLSPEKTRAEDDNPVTGLREAFAPAKAVLHIQLVLVEPDAEAGVRQAIGQVSGEGLLPAGIRDEDVRGAHGALREC